MTWQVGEPCRVHGWRGVFRVARVTDEFVTVWGGVAYRFGMRDTVIDRLRPAKRGDVVPGYPAEFGRPPTPRKGQR